MVQSVGITKQNYSVEQLKELKNAGVQGISDDDIKAAEKREAENAKASDEKNISYKIKDDASEVNEAQKEVEDAQKGGKNLRSILDDLIKKDQVKNDEMKQLQETISKYEVKMQDLYSISTENEEEATDETTEETKDETPADDEIVVRTYTFENAMDTVIDELHVYQSRGNNLVPNGLKPGEQVSTEVFGYYLHTPNETLYTVDYTAAGQN